MMEKYSVLMTVYHKADPDFLVDAVQSMLDQTVPTDDFVIVCDGPLTPVLDQILEDFSSQYAGLFQIIRLPENVGIGMANNAGLPHCKHDLVAKMDADDLSLPYRCEQQLQLFAQNPQLKVVGGYIEEFDQDPDTPFSVRTVPLSSAEIRVYAKRRQPFNNQTVMYRRSAVKAVGGYGDFRRSEDYDLYIRLLHAGFETANVGRILVKMRVNGATVMRRASWDTLKGCARSRWNALRLGYSSFLDVAVVVGAEFVIWISPPGLQRFLYNHFLRKGVSHERESSVRS